MGLIASLKENIYALYLASKDTRVPLAAKLVILLVVAYALSPVDLIPDFLPVIGYLDDIIILPLGIWLAIKLIPRDVWLSCLQQAQAEPVKLPKNWWMGCLVILLWGFLLLYLLRWLGLVSW